MLQDPETPWEELQSNCVDIENVYIVMLSTPADMVSNFNSSNNQPGFQIDKIFTSSIESFFQGRQSFILLFTWRTFYFVQAKKSFNFLTVSLELYKG